MGKGTITAVPDGAIVEFPTKGKAKEGPRKSFSVRIESDEAAEANGAEGEDVVDNKTSPTSAENGKVPAVANLTNVIEQVQRKDSARPKAKAQKPEKLEIAAQSSDT